MPKQKFFLIILSCFVIFGLVGCMQTDNSVIMDEPSADGQVSEINIVENMNLEEIMDIVDEEILELE